MNIIQQAAAEYYEYNEERPKYHTDTLREMYVEEGIHLLSYLSQQGDAAIARGIIEGSISTWYNQDDAEELVCKALAIGRATNRWIPVSERLPDEKDATEINGIKVVETLVWHKQFKCWQSDIVNWDANWIKLGNPHYWRTPSQYPEPPKSDI